MANMMDAANTAVMAVVAHCLNIGGMFAAMLSRAVGLARRRAGVGRSASASRAPLLEQQLFDPAVQLCRQPGEHVFQIRPRLVPVELGRLEQAYHHRSPLARELTAEEEPLRRPRAQGRIRFSTCLLSIGTSPSSRNLPRPAQCFKLQSMASAMALPSGTGVRSSCSHTCSSSHSGYDRSWCICSRCWGVNAFASASIPNSQASRWILDRDWLLGSNVGSMRRGSLGSDR